MTWKNFTIGELCLKVTDGSHFSPKEMDDGYPMLSVKDMAENGFNYSGAKKISQEDFLKLVKGDCQPKKDDVLIAKDGSYLKHVFVCREEKEEAILSSIAILRPNKTKITPDYLQYLLREPSVKGMMESYVSGSALPRIILKDFKKMKVSVPDIETQCDIASIISPYDALIEINNQRIKLLEETARELYKEWFVRMRFPGYKSARFEKGVPEGWSADLLLKICSRITDGTHDTPKQVEHGVPLITGKHILNGVINFDEAYKISLEDHQKIKKRSGLNEGDILFSNIGTIGSTAFVGKQTEYSVKNVIIFKPLNPSSGVFLYYLIASNGFKDQLLLDAFGTSQQFISLGHIRKVKALLPDPKLIEMFFENVKPMLDQQAVLQQQNIELRQIRDCLLPRLISGKLKNKITEEAQCL